MPSKTLKLEELHLTLASEKLKLQITPAVDIGFQSGCGFSLDDDGLVEALISGNVWVSRGRRCRVDIEIFFNSKPLSKTTRISILESLGFHLRDAQLWSQLSLSTSLEILQSDSIADSSSDISIFINHASSSAQTQPKAWLSDNIDIKAPDSVVCAEFERLHLQLRFHQIVKKTRAMSKRVKSRSSDPETPESILFDYVSGLEDDARLTFFENVAAVLPEDLSRSIAKSFDTFKINGSKGSSKLLDKTLLPSNGTVPKLLDDVRFTGVVAVDNNKPKDKPAGRRSRLSIETIDKLQGWIDTHSGNLYPTRHEKQELMKRTGLQMKQINTWFGHARHPKKRPKYMSKTADSPVQQNDASPPSEVSDENHEENMQPPLFDDEMLFNAKGEDPEEDEMLFSQTASTTPSLTSQLSTISTVSSTTSLKRTAPNEASEPNTTSSLTTLSLAPANKLTLFALQTLIAGASTRNLNLKNIKIQKPLSETPLSAFVPSMFSPGFKELIAHNSKFLPTISNAIGSSWVRNVQGAGLRRKLVALSNARVSKYHDGEGEVGSSKRLVDVVQGRLWGMMQRGLSDEGAVKRIWKSSGESNAGDAKVEEGGEDEDLLGANGGEDGGDGKDFEDYIGEEYIDDEVALFEDLLGGKGDGESNGNLLKYLEKQERLGVKAKTEEMLFGNAWDQAGSAHVEEDEEILLLGDGSHKESMLL